MELLGAEAAVRAWGPRAGQTEGSVTGHEDAPPEGGQTVTSRDLATLPG